MKIISHSTTSSTNVVSNATIANSVTQPSITNTAVSVLSEMERKRQQWETTAFKTSNKQLYSVLAECLAYGGELPTEQAKQRTAVLVEFCKARNYIFKKESPLMTRIVKAVFGNIDRRRISTYSLVLREAQKQQVLPTKLAQWIEEFGGIQEIKLSHSATFVSPKAKAETAKQSLSSVPNIAVVSNEALSLLADGNNVGEECVLLAEQQANGSFAIKALTRNSSAVNAALTALYSSQKKAAEENSKTTETAAQLVAA